MQNQFSEEGIVHQSQYKAVKYCFFVINHSDILCAYVNSNEPQSCQNKNYLLNLLISCDSTCMLIVYITTAMQG